MYRPDMEEPVSVINIEEKIGKTVGRQKRPTDPMRTADGLQRSLGETQKALGLHYGSRGVFRFKTHQEANEWTRKMTSPQKS